MKRALAGLGIVLGLALVGYAIFASQSDEEQIRERLEQLSRAVDVDDSENLLFRKTRIEREFARIFTTDVRVNITELGRSADGRASVAQLATLAARQYRSLDVEISPETVSVGSGSASVDGEVTVLSSDQDLSRAARAVAFKLVKSDDQGWQISAIRVEAGER
jgi:hypothetical protein